MKTQKKKRHRNTRVASSAKNGQSGASLPDGFSVTEEGLCAHRILTAEGVAVLEYKILFPFPRQKETDPRGAKGNARIRAFYIDLAARLQSYLQKDLFPRATRAYTESNDPHKRFRHACLSLSVLCQVSEENDRCLSVVRQVRLFRGRQVLHAHTEAEVFSKKSGKPLPLLALCRLGFPLAEGEKGSPRAATKKAAFGGFFLQNGRITVIKG